MFCCEPLPKWQSEQLFSVPCFDVPGCEPLPKWQSEQPAETPVVHLLCCEPLPKWQSEQLSISSWRWRHCCEPLPKWQSEQPAFAISVAAVCCEPLPKWQSEQRCLSFSLEGELAVNLCRNGRANSWPGREAALDERAIPPRHADEVGSLRKSRSGGNCLATGLMQCEPWKSEDRQPR